MVLVNALDFYSRASSRQHLKGQLEGQLARTREFLGRELRNQPQFLPNLTDSPTIEEIWRSVTATAVLLTALARLRALLVSLNLT